MSEEAGLDALSRIVCPTYSEVAFKEMCKEKLSIQADLDIAIEVLADLNAGVCKYYNDTYKDHDFDMCCNRSDCGCRGMPTDPEYFIWRDLKKIEIALKKIEGNKCGICKKEMTSDEDCGGDCRKCMIDCGDPDA